ncbi:TetR/AcrR family transcriptional regulator [Alicyclobacillus mengziensis]|uniref:TetR/AcrR family transcriptional regulator n=1 Tax=Alicyclobacillus mengziensis TaxID=2931921 RepID=A0A9X7VWZ2_9BACL|nr:TetR/AcrR family transcriptional regulator [Alicyclobacillus mengziensis]QSO46601.1 TetR/AcrR family transcriptional regulator [Alicyclobacillus mengziensis]
MNEIKPMNGARKRKERRESIENRQLILTTARRLFAGNGVRAVSMRQIAREAGIGQGTLYRQYTDKGALCEALLRETIEEFQNTFEIRAQASTDKALQLVEELLEQIVQFTDENSEMVSALVEVALSERRHVFHHIPFYAWAREKIMQLLTTGMESGEVQPLDAEYTAYVLLSPLVMNIFIRKGFSSERILQTTRQLLLNGVKVD